MTDVTLSATSKGKRIYHFETLSVGVAIGKLKRLGVWERLPQPVRKRAKAAHASWSSFTITQNDLDSIPDHDWEWIAAKFRLQWEPAQLSAVNDTNEVQPSFPNQREAVAA